MRTAISPPAASHRFVLLGCRADTTYQARLVLFGPSGRTESKTLDFKTAPLPPGLEDHRLVSSAGAARGYVLTDEVVFAPDGSPDPAPGDESLAALRALGYIGAANQRPAEDTGAPPAPPHSDWLRIVDRAGRVVWYEQFDTLAGFSLAADRTIAVAVRSPDGGTRRILNLGLDGRRLVDIAVPEVPNHDVLKDPDGNMVFLTAAARRVDRSPIGGRPDELVVGDGIAVYDPDGRRLWQWTSFDAFDPLRMRGRRDRFWDALFGEGAEDWLHVNSLCLDRDGNYVISLRHHDLLAKIDRRTGRLLWRLGRDGDIRLPEAARFIGQHALGVTAGGDYMIFDNGDRTRPWSRALALRVDETARQASIAWEYRLPAALYSFAISSACEIDGGHRLICSGVPGVLLEIDRSDRIIWQAASRPGLSLYRAFALPELYDAPPDIAFRLPRLALRDGSRPFALSATPRIGSLSCASGSGKVFSVNFGLDCWKRNGARDRAKRPGGGGFKLRSGRVAGLARGGKATGGHTPGIPTMGFGGAAYQSDDTGSGDSGSGRAGAVGGARDGRPRHSRMARVATGGWIAARIRMRPPQSGHSRTSTANTRRSRPREAAKFPASAFSIAGILTGSIRHAVLKMHAFKTSVLPVDAGTSRHWHWNSI